MNTNSIYSIKSIVKAPNRTIFYKYVVEGMKGNQILYIVLAVTIVLLIAIAYDSRHSVVTEGFAMNGCPNYFQPATLIYTGKKSGKICCYGEVVNGKCVGPSTPAGNQCMIGKTQNNIPECREFINNIKNELKLFFCPKSMQNMFFMKDGFGCTDGPLNPKEDGPLHSSSKQCTMNTANREAMDRDMKTNPNNCDVQARLENLECIGSKCNKFIRASPNNMTIIGMDFISPDGVPVTCYDNFGRISEVPNEKTWHFLDKHPMSCSVAKKLYLDKSMSPADVKLLP